MGAFDTVKKVAGGVPGSTTSLSVLGLDKALGGSPDLGGAAIKEAMDRAVSARLETFKEATAATQPFREAGGRAVAELSSNIQPGGSLFTQQDVTGRSGIADELARRGFTASDIGGGVDRFGESLGAREFDARIGRAADLTDLGTKFATREAGALGTLGQGLASSFQRGGSDIANALQTKASARSAGIATAFQGAQKGLGDLFLASQLRRNPGGGAAPVVVNPSGSAASPFNTGG